MQNLSRRTVVGALAALAAQGALGGPARAQAPAARIDTHHHIIPPDWLAAKREQILAANSSTQAILDWTATGALAEMDRRNITAAIASITTPGVWFGDVAEGRRLARVCNEYGAQLSRDHPSRFGMFAALPLPDIDGSLAEIAYAYDTLKLDGIGLLTSYGEHWPGESIFDPVFAELNRRKAIVFFHPTGAACCAHVVGDLPPSIVEYGFNTTRAIESMLFSGTFNRYPDIRYIFSHGGGTVPFLADRIGSTSYARRPEVRALLPDGPGPVLRTLYFDVVSVSNPPAMAALRAMMPASRLLFGTDNPFVAPSATIDGLAALNLPAPLLASIQHDNAAALFPRFG
jgi:predicted TIM-barrel fold metal-dependent hydrolase